MPKNSHSSHGNNDFSVELDISDYTEEITDAIKQAIRRGLTKIGLKAERYAKQTVHVITGRLRNSITHEVDEGEMAVYIGTNVEYAPYEEEGTSKRPAHTKSAWHDRWRYTFPAEGTTRRWANVPSQELSDMLVEAFKDQLKD